VHDVVLEFDSQLVVHQVQVRGFDEGHDLPAQLAEVGLELAGLLRLEVPDAEHDRERLEVIVARSHHHLGILPQQLPGLTVCGLLEVDLLVLQVLEELLHDELLEDRHRVEFVHLLGRHVVVLLVAQVDVLPEPQRVVAELRVQVLLLLDDGLQKRQLQQRQLRIERNLGLHFGSIHWRVRANGSLAVAIVDLSIV